MSEDKEEYVVPEGKEHRTVLGLGFVVPAGTPEELLVAIADGMVQSGHAIFDPVTNTLKPNPEVSINGKLHGLSMNVDDSGNVRNAKTIPDEQVKKHFGVDKLTGYTSVPKPKK